MTESNKSALDKAREVRDKIAEKNRAINVMDEVSDSAEAIFAPAEVEHHTQLAPAKHYSTIKGLEEVSTDIIPLPFYKLVQPGSTNIKINEDGEDADPGHFFQGDTGSAAERLKVGIVRAKRIIKEYQGKRSLTIGILGVNLENMTPFLMNISVASFSNFGRMMNVLNQRKIDAIWKYPITITSEKVETKKNINGQDQMVKYWVMDFTVAEEGFDKDDLDTMKTVLDNYSGSLDRDGLDED